MKGVASMICAPRFRAACDALQAATEALGAREALGSREAAGGHSAADVDTARGAVEVWSLELDELASLLQTAEVLTLLEAERQVLGTPTPRRPPRPGKAAQPSALAAAPREAGELSCSGEVHLTRSMSAQAELDAWLDAELHDAAASEVDAADGEVASSAAMDGGQEE